MMEAAWKFYFRADPPQHMVEDITRYVREFGRGHAEVQKEGRFAVLYLDDTRDAELVRNQFGGFLDTWVDLT